MKIISEDIFLNFYFKLVKKNWGEFCCKILRVDLNKMYFIF